MFYRMTFIKKVQIHECSIEPNAGMGFGASLFSILTWHVCDRLIFKINLCRQASRVEMHLGRELLNDEVKKTDKIIRLSS